MNRFQMSVLEGVIANLRLVSQRTGHGNAGAHLSTAIVLGESILEEKGIFYDFVTTSLPHSPDQDDLLEIYDWLSRIEHTIYSTFLLSADKASDLHTVRATMERIRQEVLIARCWIKRRIKPQATCKKPSIHSALID